MFRRKKAPNAMDKRGGIVVIGWGHNGRAVGALRSREGGIAVTRRRHNGRGRRHSRRAGVGTTVVVSGHSGRNMTPVNQAEQLTTKGMPA